MQQARPTSSKNAAFAPPRRCRCPGRGRAQRSRHPQRSALGLSQMLRRRSPGRASEQRLAAAARAAGVWQQSADTDRGRETLRPAYWQVLPQESNGFHCDAKELLRAVMLSRLDEPALCPQPADLFTRREGLAASRLNSSINTTSGMIGCDGVDRRNIYETVDVELAGCRRTCGRGWSEFLS
jgi:hypothetical protein